jgi:hypothetical protein
MGKIATTLASVNKLVTAPFNAKLPIMPIALLFVLALVVAFEWRLIVDRIEEVVE